MNRAAKQIAVCAALLLLVCLICRLTVFRTFTAYLPENVHDPETALPVDPDTMSFTAEEEGMLRIGEPVRKNGRLGVSVEPLKAGRTSLLIRDPSGREVMMHDLRIGRFHTVYDSATGAFTGDTAVLIAVTLFWLLAGAIMVWNFFRARGPAFYGYATIYYAGFSIFALVNFGLMLHVTVTHLTRPEDFVMLAAYSEIEGAALRFMLITSPLIIAFALAMGISNAVLLRHERPGPQNALGLIVGLLLIAGVVFGLLFGYRDFSGSEWEHRVSDTLTNVCATAFVYFECMLAGSVICGIRAAKHRPAPDKDFIVILGCWFRRDGTLPPLLKGRVDRALAFWKRQKEETGREAMLIPSGGQGSDEPMPEAEAMRRYLLSQDVPDRLIRVEDRSHSTAQNMAFSRELIRQINPEGKTVFATTNYHVFRSGVWAAEAGLAAEGIGSRTKWWYWPNAFMRECAGLLLKRWRQELLFLVILVGFYGLLTMVLG